MFDHAEAAYRLMGLDFQLHFDISFHHGIFYKGRRIFFMGFISEIEGRGRVFIVWWLATIAPATISDVAYAVRAEMHRDLPDWIAFARGLRGEKDLRYYRVADIERIATRYSTCPKPTEQ